MSPHDLTLHAIVALGAYVAGAIPFGVVAARLFGLGDLRRVGSGNIGATNVLRTGNKLAAMLTLIGDSGKGAAAVMIAGAFEPLLAVTAGVAALLGHVFSFWLKFNGGKGVATAAGVIAAWNPLAGLATALCWLAGAFGTRISAVGALLGGALAPLWVWLFGTAPEAVGCAIVSTVVIARHHANIGRLMRGDEPRFGRRAR